MDQRLDVSGGDDPNRILALSAIKPNRLFGHRAVPEIDNEGIIVSGTVDGDRVDLIDRNAVDAFAVDADVDLILVDLQMKRIGVAVVGVRAGIDDQFAGQSIAIEHAAGFQPRDVQFREKFLSPPIDPSPAHRWSSTGELSNPIGEFHDDELGINKAT